MKTQIKCEENVIQLFLKTFFKSIQIKIYF
jgi:hypothetical protein